MESKSFSEIFSIILERQAAKESKNSYVASLMEKGVDAILKKIGEEPTEVILASKNSQSQECIHELTDLWFHLMVLMAHQNIALEEIEVEFGRRFGRSGLDEKANRTKIK